MSDLPLLAMPPEMAQLFPDRSCLECGESNHWLQFFPLTPSGRNWNLTCFDCRSGHEREPVPELPIRNCGSCRRDKSLAHFTAVVSGRVGVVVDCYRCRRKDRRPA